MFHMFQRPPFPSSTPARAQASRPCAGRDRSFAHWGTLLVMLAGTLAAGCETERQFVYRQERFDAVDLHSRSFAVVPAQTCEAARRALLSNGYLVQRSNAELVDGRKSFQPTLDTHVEIDVHVVCAAEGPERSTIFVNALQDRYALKKTINSASLGVGPVGSVSLPFGSSSDSMVKIASETIPSADFYSRFFFLVEQFLANAPESSETADADDEGGSGDAGNTGNTAQRPRPDRKVR